MCSQVHEYSEGLLPASHDALTHSLEWAYALRCRDLSMKSNLMPQEEARPLMRALSEKLACAVSALK